MKKRLAIIVSALAVWGTLVLAQGARSPEALFKAAQHTEEVQGDLKTAIEQYKKVVTAGNRSLAAQALLRVAECYQKLGDNQSRQIYERVLHEFADQSDAAVTARRHLDAPAAPTGGLVSRRVWRLPENCCNVFGTISPDGRSVAYIDWASGANLVLHDLQSNVDRRLTDAAAERGEMSSLQLTGAYTFSRDGKQLAYSWLNLKSGRHELRVVSAHGSGIPTARRLYDNPDVEWIGPHDWSPDDKWIAVALHRQDHAAQIGLLSTETGLLRVLKSVDWEGPSHIFFSPNGKYLAFDLQRDVFVLAIDGSREVPAVVHPAEDALMGWSPDGERLLFTSDRTGAAALWAIRFADGGIHGPPELIKSDVAGGKGDLPGTAQSLGVTTNGSLYSVAYFGRGEDILQAAFDFERGQFVSSPAPAIQTFVGTNRAPAWSPDGKLLAYLTRDRVVAIRLMESGQTREVSLVKTMSYIETFGWGADGRSFLVGGTDSKGRRGVFRVDAQTGQSVLIVTPEPNPDRLIATASAVESPDAQFLYYGRYQVERSTGTQTFTIVRRENASGKDTDLVQRGNLNGMTLSPDGRHLATVSIDKGTKRSSVLLVPTAGGAPHELMGDDRVRLAVQMWAPDSRSLFVRKDSELWRAPLDGRPPAKLDLKVDPNMRVFRVHPDGRQLAIQMRVPTRPEEVWVLQNFLPAVKTSSR